MTMLARLQTYVLTRTLGGVGSALVAITAMVMLINFVELSRSVGGSIELGFTQLFILTLLKSPFIICAVGVWVCAEAPCPT